ncbi:MAG: tetratricopeptide repeat protein [Fimbriimonadales bacterium]|nr:tetratricopeptide repeat protein [Fimbriimonadales bacterium]
MNLKGVSFVLGGVLATTTLAVGADISGSVVFQSELTGPASLTVVDAAQNKFEAKLTQNGEFMLTGIAPGDVAVTIKVGRQVFDIPRMRVESGRNDVTLYYPQTMDLEARSKGAETTYTRGSQLLQAGEYAEAISQLTLSLTFDTAQSPTWGAMALCYVGLGRLEDAVFCGRMAVRFDPEESSYWNNLGSTYYRMKRFEDAVAMYERAAALNASGAGLYFSNAAAAYYALNRNSEAIEAYEKATRVEGCPPGSWFHLGSLLARTGQIARAASALREYLAKQPTGQYAESAKRLLSQLER